jgi:ech hydrogenase subunit A
MNKAIIVTALVAGPVLWGVVAGLSKPAKMRNAFVILGSFFTIIAGLLALKGGRFTFSPGPWEAGLSFALELATILAILGVAIRIRSRPILYLAALQLAVALAGHIIGTGTGGVLEPVFILDALSMVLVLVISLVGPVIVLFAIGYMEQHAHHAPPTAAGERRFFFIMLAFLGAMNGLVLANSLQWLASFWEITTLCSFFLIGYDGTDESRANAQRALLINTFGGLALTVGSFWCITHGTDTLTGLKAAQLVIPMAFLCLAALTKSAQVPFQSWLLGAMVAPTPVSALLHSATMVKAGSYLVLRLAPAFRGTDLMVVLALTGAFTFAAASFLAIVQSNAKKVLAYSTISNLGLIVACAGIDSPLAYAAAVMILIYHAVSKGLLFLCVGTIEQSIGSRDIEDMGGIMYKMPFTTVVALLGMVSMLLPPFGMLLSKWMAIEASINMPVVMFLIVVGSAFSVLFWAKWLGRIQTVSFHPRYTLEPLSPFMRASLFILAVGVLVLGFGSIILYRDILRPMVTGIFQRIPVGVSEWSIFRADSEFAFWPFIVIPGVFLILAIISSLRIRREQVRLPYLAGENVDMKDWSVDGDVLSYSFRTFRDRFEPAWSSSQYMRSSVNEAKIVPWLNMVAFLLILAMFGKIHLL